MKSDFMLIGGSADDGVADGTARILEVRRAKGTVARFPDSEVNVSIHEPVRGRNVFIIASSSPPVDEHLIEILAIADACRRASAATITWVAPYFGYSRSDKRGPRRAPVMASLAARLAETSGIGHLITTDLHSAQIEGFFHIPVEQLTAVPALAEAMRPVLNPDSVIISPDAGRVKMATEYSARLGFPVVVLHKERLNGEQTEVTRVVGEVRGRPCVLVDDIISTGRTVSQAIQALLKAGAAPDFIVAATHPVFAEGVRENLSHPGIRRIFVTNSIGIDRAAWPGATVISLGPLVAASIRRALSGESMADLFTEVMRGGIESLP